MPGASSSLQRQEFGWSRAKKSFLTTSATVPSHSAPSA